MKAAGKLVVRFHKNDEAPLSLHTETITVAIHGPSTGKGKTANLDLVVVLDTSSSMHGRKLHDVKQAAEFLIRKIGKLDTLTFVPFASTALKPSADPPPFMSTGEKHKATSFVKALTTHHGTNIKDGLQTAVDILRRRTDKTGRASAVFLMSDGRQTVGDARDVHVHDVSVYTFGFGHEHDHYLLEHIAKRSAHGTYHVSTHSTIRNRLLRDFAMVLGRLRDVSALDLAVTLKQVGENTLIPVNVRNYRVTSGDDRSYTYNFGDLARTEVRKITVKLQLPAVDHNIEKERVMSVQCSYRQD